MKSLEPTRRPSVERARYLGDQTGVDPMEAIRAATYWPAVAMKADKDYGTVSEGKYADIIAVRGDILRYINLLQNVSVVIKHGKQYKWRDRQDVRRWGSPAC